MRNIRGFRMRGLALVGACGLVFMGAGCSQSRQAVFTPRAESLSWSSSIFASSSILTPSTIDTRSFFLEAPLMMEDEMPSRDCPTNDAPEPILFLGHYSPASAHFVSTVAAWEACSKRRVRHIVIVSPDHYRRLEGGFSTTNQSYRIKDRTVSSSEHLVERFQQAGGRISSLFTQEHGVGVPLTIASRQWSELESATAVVVSRKISEREAEALARELRQIADRPDTLIVLSVDFSHGLFRDEAHAMDRITKRAFIHRDRSFFWNASDVYTDFGRGLWLVLSLLPERGRVYIDQSFDSVNLGGGAGNVTTFMSGWMLRP